MADNMLDYLRITIYTILIIIGFLLFQAWQIEHPQTDQPITQTENKEQARFVPVPEVSKVDTVKTLERVEKSDTATQVVPTQLIKVQTDVLQVAIDTLGGDITQVNLLKFPESLDSKNPFVLLNNDPKTRYIAESGLLSKRGPDTSNAQARYTVTQNQFELTPEANQLQVVLNWHNNAGLNVDKVYTFTRGSYEIKVNYIVNNQSNTPWEGNLYTQLMRTDNPPPNHGGVINLTTFFGAAISTPKNPFLKIPFKDMRSKDFSMSGEDGWAAMIQHYFISAWIPLKETTSNYYSRVLPNGLYTIGMIGSTLTAAPQSQVQSEATLYAGPAKTDLLAKASPTLKLTIDYGWFWFISVIIFWMMQKIYEVVGNWGWSIVLVTVIIKLMFYHLSAKSYRSMSVLKRLQPRLEALKERYGDDKQKFTQATLELYREEKVNPMSGCLPILIQIPVFIALYWVLVESVELRQAPFIFWIRDLSQHDPFYVLPILMGLSMYVQQRLNPPPPDPVQAKVMMFMPVIFTVLFANFPAGLMLYWFVNNTLSFLQQWHIMHRLDVNSKAKKST